MPGNGGFSDRLRVWAGVWLGNSHPAEGLRPGGWSISTDYTLKQIIEQTSYQTKYSIAKAFKKHFGISTSQYREKHRPNGENPATNIKPEIKVISPIKIFCIEVGEAYKNKLKYRLLWNKLLHHDEQYEADPRYDKFISLSMDDPSIMQRPTQISPL